MTSSPTTLDQLLLSAARPEAPLATYYDLATGERTEISVTTTLNWVAKAANLLIDELDAEPGTRLRLGLPTHWLRVVWLLAAWRTGVTVTDGGGLEGGQPQTADIGLSGPDLTADEPVRLAASLHPFALPFPAPFAGTAGGFIDLGTALPGQGDHFVAPDPPTPDTVALEADGLAVTHGDLLAATAPDDRRLLVDSGSLGRDARLVIAVALGGGSLVLVSGGEAEERSTIGVQEQATAWTPGV